METQAVYTGFIGTGRHAEWSHLEQLATIPEAKLHRLSDIKTDRPIAMRDAFAPGTEISSRWQDVIEDDAIQAVYIMTPDRLHTPQLLASIEAGKHTFTEKPLADTWEDYTSLRIGLLTAPEQLVLSSCHPRRFDRPFVLTKQFLDNREKLAEAFGLPEDTDFGPVEHFTLDLNYSRPTKSGLHTSFASDHLPHEIDTVSDFFGLSGFFAMSRVNEELEFDIEGARQDGIGLRFRGNRLQAEKGWREDWQVEFADNVIFSVNAYTGEIALRHNGVDIRPARTPRDALDKPVFKTDYDARFTALNAHFIRSVINKEQEPPYLTRQEMLINTVTALALQEVDKPVGISMDGSVVQL